MSKTKILTNIKICDGTGAEVFSGEIHWQNELITKIGPPQNNRATKHNYHIIDGKGFTACPGFIDTHTHSDAALFCNFSPIGRFAQGITTEITGNCGLSAFPLTHNNLDNIKNIFSRYNGFLSLAKEQLNAHDFHYNLKNSTPLNIYPLLGYNTLRSAVAGYSKKELTQHAITQMQELAEQQLTQGAIGISGGFLYVPGIFATNSEIVQILSRVSKYNPIFTCHLRSEGIKLLEAIQEMIIVCQESGIKNLHISHLKTAGKANWHKINELFSLLENKHDLKISFDRYPYTESLSSLSLVLPSRFKAMTDVNIQKHLQNKKNIRQVTNELISYNENYWNSVRLAGIGGKTAKGLQGMTVKDAAKTLSIHPAKLITTILSENSPEATAAFSGMNYDNMLRIISHKNCCCGSDETARPNDYSLGFSHPRGFGSMPEFINLLTQKRNFSFAEAVKKVTSLPAQIFKLSQRGSLKKGNYADIVLLDPDNYHSKADFHNPHQPADGVKELWINGKSVYKSNNPL